MRFERVRHRQQRQARRANVKAQFFHRPLDRDRIAGRKKRLEERDQIKVNLCGVGNSSIMHRFCHLAKFLRAEMRRYSDHTVTTKSERRQKQMVVTAKENEILRTFAQ